MVHILAEIKKLTKLESVIFWPSLYKDIDNYIIKYLPCVQFNPRRKQTFWSIKIN